MQKSFMKTRRRAVRRSMHRYSHEIKSVRLMTNRHFRRRGKLLARSSEDPNTPSRKEYKTGGWISW